jgi:hypothetical protein
MSHAPEHQCSGNIRPVNGAMEDARAGAHRPLQRTPICQMLEHLAAWRHLSPCPTRHPGCIPTSST